MAGVSRRGRRRGRWDNEGCDVREAGATMEEERAEAKAAEMKVAVAKGEERRWWRG